MNAHTNLSYNYIGFQSINSQWGRPLRWGLILEYLYPVKHIVDMVRGVCPQLLLVPKFSLPRRRVHSLSPRRIQEPPVASPTVCTRSFEAVQLMSLIGFSTNLGGEGDRPY